MENKIVFYKLSAQPFLYRLGWQAIQLYDWLMVLKATINQSRLSTQTIPEIVAPQACTHFPYSFWSGEFCIIVF